MADDEPGCKVEYLDTLDGVPEETNWIKRAGKAKVTYPDGSNFTGYFDEEKIKQGEGVYVFMKPGAEDDDPPVEKARFEGFYVNGIKHGVGKMVFPNGDVYEGEWVQNKIQGEGSYTYKKTGDIYSGSWVDGKKHGEGRYEFGEDSSVLVGTWEAGQILQGTWELKKAGSYKGSFKLGRPFGAGEFSFASGITQTGTYIEEKTEEDQQEEGEEPKPPTVAWRGQSIVSF